MLVVGGERSVGGAGVVGDHLQPLGEAVEEEVKACLQAGVGVPAEAVACPTRLEMGRSMPSMAAPRTG